MTIQKGPNMRKEDEGFDVPKTMSNLTSASGEASASSGNRTEIGSDYSQQYFATPPTQTQKKKRNLPGNPGFYIYLQSSKQSFFWFWFVCCMSLSCLSQLGLPFCLVWCSYFLNCLFRPGG